MAECVHSFLVSEDDFETMKEVLEYLDPEEGVSIVYVRGRYLCTFDNRTFVKIEGFKEHFSRAIVSFTKKSTI
jgi:hypothetical protein